jgi:hypothetical protein
MEMSESFHGNVKLSGARSSTLQKCVNQERRCRQIQLTHTRASALASYGFVECLPGHTRR